MARFDPEAKRQKRLKIYEGATGLGTVAGGAKLVPMALNASDGYMTVKERAGNVNTLGRKAGKKYLKSVKAPNQGLKTINRNEAKRVATSAGRQVKFAGKTLVRVKALRKPAAATLVLGAATAGLHGYRKSEANQAWGEYKTYGRK